MKSPIDRRKTWLTKPNKAMHACHWKWNMAVPSVPTITRPIIHDVNGTRAVIGRCLWYIGVYTMMWMLRALWLVVAHDLLEYRYMDDVTRNLFSLFCSTWRAVLKMFVRLFQIKASESLKKRISKSYLKEKNGEKERKRVLYNLRMPKLQEIFTRVAIVCHCYERLAVLKNVFTIILLWARKYVEKLFEETVYKWDKEKKKKQRRNIAFWT